MSEPFGAPINICNGMNEGACQDPEEVITKRPIRPFKVPTPPPSDEPKEDSLTVLWFQGPESGAPIPICNGANAGACTEADEVVKNRLRRPHKRAAPGDPDYPAQEAADKQTIAKK